MVSERLFGDIVSEHRVVCSPRFRPVHRDAARHSKSSARVLTGAAEGDPKLAVTDRAQSSGVTGVPGASTIRPATVNTSLDPAASTTRAASSSPPKRAAVPAGIKHRYIRRPLAMSASFPAGWLILSSIRYSSPGLSRPRSSCAQASSSPIFASIVVTRKLPGLIPNSDCSIALTRRTSLGPSRARANRRAGWRIASALIRLSDHRSGEVAASPSSRPVP